MRIQIGTKVKFLNDVGGGVVRGFSDDKMAIVETEDGFEMPMLVTELMPDITSTQNEEKTGNGKSQNSSTPLPEQKPSLSFEEKKFAKLQGEAFLALVPQNDKILHVSNFDLYLINDSNYSLQYTISIKDSPVATHLVSGVIEPDTKDVLEEFSQTSISKIQSFRLQGIFFKQGLMEQIPAIDNEFSIEGISFYKINSFSDNEYFHQKALLLKKMPADNEAMEEAIKQLKESDIAVVVNSKERTESQLVHKSPKNTGLEEVDLHIEEIVENTRDLSNGEIVNIQMSRFETALETALRSKTQKIVFIHGVGNGILKHELRKKLDRKYPDLRYQDASFKEYGYGATMVYLK